MTARVAVLVSGGGSNLQALIDAAAAPDYPARIVLVISNNADAYGLIRAQKAGIATAVIDHRKFPDRETFEDAIQTALESAGADIVCLAGFMRILTAGFVARWEGQMLNIHPSLLPKYKGLHTHQRALDAGDKIHGCSVHMVQPELDGGPVMIRAIVPVHGDDSVDTLAARVLVKEHMIYPAALRLLAMGAVQTSSKGIRLGNHAGQIDIPAEDEMETERDFYAFMVKNRWLTP